VEKYQIVKNIFLIIIFMFFFNGVFCLENPAAISPSTQGDTFLLPPVRRLGVDFVDTNIDKFRIFMRKQDQLLYGLPAFPFNEQDIQRLIADDVIDEIKNTGRFWDISLSEFVKLLPLSGGQNSSNDFQKIEKLKRRLELDYNIDAWLKPSVYFAPDQTLVRIVLKGPYAKATIWAREDITLEAQASEEKIKKSFSQALSRLVNTIGHDGKITYIRENILTVDFGLERGIVRGETLYGGFVILTSFHPQTGEFLRAQRIPIHELRVLESRQGSSLCQIVASDRLAFEQALKLLGTNDVKMLVWRKTKNMYKEGWREPYNPETAPILGAVEEGFGTPLAEGNKPESPRSIIPPVIFEKEDKNKKTVAQGNETQDKNLKGQTEQQGLPYAIPAKDENKPNFPNVTYKKSVINRPETWEPYTALFGTGLTIGADNGVNSSFPKTIINKISALSYIEMDSTIELKLIPYAQFSNFNSNSLTGNSFYAGVVLLNTINHISPNNSLSVGGSLEYMAGSLNYNCNCFPSSDLTHAALMANAMWENKQSGFGNYDVIAGVSIFDFFQAVPIWSIRSDVRPFAFLPKEIVFDLEIKRFYSGWTEFSVGVSWDFLSEYKYLKPIL
jgi:hypothetical protein